MGYTIRPDNGCTWMLRKDTVTGKTAGESGTCVYPVSLERCLERILQDKLREDEGAYEVADALSKVKELYEEVRLGFEEASRNIKR